MAFIPVPGVAMIEMIFNWQLQVCENTLYFEGAGAWDATNLSILADDCRDWWDANLKAQVSSQVSLVAVRATSLESQNAPGIEYTATLPLSGTRASPALPNNVTIAVGFKTALRGRNFRGRNYFIGLCEDQVTNNTLEAANLASILTAYNAIDTVVSGANSGVHVVVSRFLNNAPRVAGVATPVTDYSIDPTIDSMRRRLPGRGA